MPEMIEESTGKPVDCESNDVLFFTTRSYRNAYDIRMIFIGAFTQG
jgi:hypothetical protein